MGGVSEPLTPELQAEAAEACGATEDWWQDPRIGPFDPAPAPGTPIDERVRLADKRGDRIQLVISNGELPSNWGPEMILEQLQTCTYRADTGKAVAGLPFSRYDAADFTAGQAVSQVALIAVGGTWDEIGQTRDGVVSMTAEHLGLEMEVKIEDGFYSLWWPHGSKTQLDELHWEDPKASVVYTITFADGHTETLTDTPWSFDWADKLEERAPHVDGGGTAWEDADSAEPLTPELTADAAEACVADPDWAPWEGDVSPPPAERVVLAEKRGDLIILILTVADGSTMWHGAPVDTDCTYNVESGVVFSMGDHMIRLPEFDTSPIREMRYGEGGTRMMVGPVRDDVVAVTVIEAGQSIDAGVENGYVATIYPLTDEMKQAEADLMKMSMDEVAATPGLLYGAVFEVTLKDGTVLVGGLGPRGSQWSEKE